LNAPPSTNFSFPRAWQAEILHARPAILPARHFVYPVEVEEVERGALEVLVRPDGPGSIPFLATCAVGFRDPVVPTGVWSLPNPSEICAVSGGYAYIIDTTHPQRFTMLPYRPVLHALAAAADNLVLFAGNLGILAWGPEGEAWQSPKLSDEGLTLLGIANGKLHGMGWNMMTDRETPFTIDLQTGKADSR
jgi:hypothetical protein